MLILQDITYQHPNRDLLFTGLNFNLNPHDKTALIGNNGAGKSTLLKILAGQLQPGTGLVKAASKPYYVPQLLDDYKESSIAEVLHLGDKLQAMQEILAGQVTDENLAILNDDWDFESRCAQAFAYWKLEGLDLAQKMSSLSGGQKTKVFLAGIRIHQPEIILMDEPSNHLDRASRILLYDEIRFSKKTLLIVSHDRELLNLLNVVAWLGPDGISSYGGNYECYVEQREIESAAFAQTLKSKEKALRKAKEVERTALERQHKLDARGKRKQEKAGVPTIMMKTLKNNAEKSTSRLKGQQAEKLDGIAQEISELRKDQPGHDRMKMDLDASALHIGKTLITAKEINFSYEAQLLWQQGLSFQIKTGDRLAIKGANGSGKTTLIKIILGSLQPKSGSIARTMVHSIYVDQEYSLIDPNLNVYEQAQQFNAGALQEHEIKLRLNRFLFTKAQWDKPCSSLSGGERMRLILCALTIGNQSPDLIVLDEPTNNLDMQNIEILTAAINEYKGTLVVISHDYSFLNQINVEEGIVL
ncbi:ABC-F family ATP-binding cassette domain-containing protein [Pedobacter gandavensis]|uniref:ATP-binding cassette domain-containing protein n=1 Tax=Pedobacter gandavensis TaxID=2679963 RepID=A0ABR6ESU3_9SPHI|nr:ABC-F family ATP-binding cassette domain-containing protein [Pedobacter gandavensis]MBB2147884.1 ATP-binding cassette domain-containing protein [Pedobacter gandavensis]